MERLSYIELLCLRVSEGLGTERDENRLRKAGIDPEEWQTLTKNLRSALASPPTPELADSVCQELNISRLSLREALSPPHIPNLVRGISEAIGVDVGQEAPPDPILSSPEMSLTDTVSEEAPVEPIEDQVVDTGAESEEITAEVLAEQESAQSLSDVLSPAVIPDLLDGIMAHIEPEVQQEDSGEMVLEEDSGEMLLEGESEEIILEGESEEIILESAESPVLTLLQPKEIVAEDDDSDEVFILETDSIIAEPEMDEADFKIEDNLETILSEALATPPAPDMSDWIMEHVEEIGVPSTHLRLVSEEQALEEKNASTTYQERIGEVDVEIQDISSPRVIDGDSAAGTWSLAGMLLLAAAAAIFVVNQVIGQSPYETGAVVENSEIAQGTEILDVTSDDHIQIQSDGSMTIIFIDVGE
jgi:hypothetical protein